LFIDIDIAL